MDMCKELISHSGILSPSQSQCGVLSVDPPVFAVPQCSRQVLAALVLPTHLTIRQGWSSIAGGTSQSNIQKTGPWLQEMEHPWALIASLAEDEVSSLFSREK